MSFGTLVKKCVRWVTALSSFFLLATELAKGVFCRRIYSMAIFVSCFMSFEASRVGCCVGDMLVNVLAYADDIVLLAPLWRGLHVISS